MNDEQGTKDLKERTTDFALRIIRLCASLERGGTAGVISRQLLRSGTSVGAQYREARRARSPLEFISKIECAVQELDESSYWMDLLQGAGLVKATKLANLRVETEELTKVLVASVRTAKKNKEMRGR